jgi:hypothetical protein
MLWKTARSPRDRSVKTESGFCPRKTENNALSQHENPLWFQYGDNNFEKHSRAVASGAATAGESQQSEHQ